MAAEYELSIRELEGDSGYEWFLARAGCVIEHGIEPGLPLCLVSASFGLDPDAAVAIEFCGYHPGSYTASRLQRTTSVVAYQILGMTGPSGGGDISAPI